MTRRRVKRKYKIAKHSQAKDGEPPDPGTAIVLASLAGTAALAGGITSATHKAPQTPSQRAVLANAPQAAQPTQLTPGQKTNLINTSPQGVLDPAASNRSTLLGN